MLVVPQMVVESSMKPMWRWLKNEELDTILHYMLHFYAMLEENPFPFRDWKGFWARCSKALDDRFPFQMLYVAERAGKEVFPIYQSEKRGYRERFLWAMEGIPNSVHDIQEISRLLQEKKYILADDEDLVRASMARLEIEVHPMDDLLPALESKAEEAPGRRTLVARICSELDGKRIKIGRRVFTIDQEANIFEDPDSLPERFVRLFAKQGARGPEIKAYEVPWFNRRNYENRERTLNKALGDAVFELRRLRDEADDVNMVDAHTSRDLAENIIRQAEDKFWGEDAGLINMIEDAAKQRALEKEIEPEGPSMAP